MNYFLILKKLIIDQIIPKLIINLDETGFGGFKAVKKRGKRVLVKKVILENVFIKLKNKLI